MLSVWSKGSTQKSVFTLSIYKNIIEYLRNNGIKEKIIILDIEGE